MNELEELIKIIEVLRSPKGCKWDREQTHSTLRPNMIEEAYEAVEAINENNPSHIQEELGDVLLQVLLHSQIAREEGNFNIEDVAKGIKEKLIRRHPHVFGDVKVKDSSEIIDNWEKIKKNEKPERTSVMSGITKGQPSLLSALKISKKAVKAGFEWPDNESLYECLLSEIEEFKAAKTPFELEDELGDILFSVVNLARRFKIDPENALIHTNRKFIKRFKAMEELTQKPLESLTLEEYDLLWNRAKELTK